MFLLLTYYFQGILGFTQVQAGLAFLPFIAGIVIASNVVSNIALARLGPKVIVPVGMILAGAGAAWLTRIGPHGSYGYTVAPALVITGLGVACAVVTAFSLGPTRTRPADIGVAASLVQQQQPDRLLARRCSAQHDRGQRGRDHLGSHPAGTPVTATVHGDVTAFAFLAVLFAAGAVVTGLLHPRRTAISLQPHPRPGSGIQVDDA